MKKESFIVYKSFYEPIKTLSDKQLGRLFRALFDYQIEGSTGVDADIQMAFAFFKNQMDIDENKYQKVCQRNKQNGSKGGRRPKEENASGEKRRKSEEINPKNPVGFSEPKKADNDNDNDNEKQIPPLPPTGGNPSRGKPPAKPLKQKYGELGNVLLTEKEFASLTVKFGAHERDARIERLDLYLASKWKRYKSHYATILSWARKDEKESQERQTTPFRVHSVRDVRSLESEEIARRILNAKRAKKCGGDGSVELEHPLQIGLQPSGT